MFSGSQDSLSPPDSPPPSHNKVPESSDTPLMDFTGNMSSVLMILISACLPKKELTLKDSTLKVRNGMEKKSILLNLNP